MQQELQVLELQEQQEPRELQEQQVQLEQREQQDSTPTTKLAHVPFLEGHTVSSAYTDYNEVDSYLYHPF